MPSKIYLFILRHSERIDVLVNFERDFLKLLLPGYHCLKMFFAQTVKNVFF